MKLKSNFYIWIPAVISIVVYWQILGFGFAWEDDFVVIGPQTRDFHLMLKSFYENPPGLHFIPFHFLQCYLINLIFGKHAFPFGFHLYQLLLNMFSCIMATLILFKITKSKLISILIVSLWIVHPLNVEVLTRLGCGPAQVAAGLFCLLFLYCFLKIRETQPKKNKIFFLCLGLFFYLASVTSYEQYIFFPLVLVLILIYLEGMKVLKEKDFVRFYIFPILFILPIYLLWKYFACGCTLFETSDELTKWTEIGSLRDTTFRALWLSPQLLVHYFRLFFWPDFSAESQADWYTVGNSIWSIYSLFCQLFVVCLIIASFCLYKKIPLFSIGIFWFFIPMLLVVQIIPFFTIADEHYCYLSSLGIFISIFGLLTYSVKHIKPQFLIAIILPIFGILTWRTLLYVPTLKDTLSRYISMAQHSSPWLKIANIGNALIVAKMTDRTNELPDWINEDSLNREVLKWVEKYLYVKPNLSHYYGPMQYPPNYLLYKLVCYKLYTSGYINDAKLVMEQALGIKNNWLGWQQNTDFLKSVHLWDDAWASLQKSIELNPSGTINYSESFIEIAHSTDKLDEAEQLIQNYIKLKPKSAHPYLFAGLFYKVLNDKERSMYYFKEGISKDKIISVNYIELYYQAATLFFENGMLDLAEQSLKIITNVNPFEPKTKQLLAKIKTLKRGDVSENKINIGLCKK